MTLGSLIYDFLKVTKSPSTQYIKSGKNRIRIKSRNRASFPPGPDSPPARGRPWQQLLPSRQKVVEMVRPPEPSHSPPGPHSSPGPDGSRGICLRRQKLGEWWSPAEQPYGPPELLCLDGFPSLIRAVQRKALKPNLSFLLGHEIKAHLTNSI